MSGLERVKQLRDAAKAAAVRFNADPATRDFRSNRDKDPTYHGATFLYIRGYDGDVGHRPIPQQQVFWDSPDIELFDSAGSRIANNQLAAGGAYTAEVTITNDGDLDCNTCLVELFLDDPSIGFNTGAATLLGAQIAAVGGRAKAAVRFSFTATSEMVGHRCMFARVSSILTNDLPSDWVNFVAMQDRHVGQQNLNIVQQGTSLQFHVCLTPALRGKALALDLLPDPAAFTAAPRAIVGRYALVHGRLGELRRTAVVRRAAPVLPGGRGVAVAAPGRPRPREPALAYEPIRRDAERRWAFQSGAARETLRIDVPDLGLGTHEAMPLELRLTDPATGQVVGGITLLVVA